MLDWISHHWPIVFVVTLAVVAWLLARLTRPDPKLPYEKRTSLLTPAELNFYRVLQEAVHGDWAVQSMVRMADLVRVAPETPKFQAWQNRIHAKHIDFLLCDHGTMEVRLAVELDDRSHQRPDRVDRDEFVNRALADAGLPLLRVEVQDQYNSQEIRKSIDQFLAP
jgi:very-short-patch-repair endonuclease